MREREMYEIFIWVNDGFTFPRLCFGTGGFVGFGGLKVGRGVLEVVGSGLLVVVVPLVVTNTLPFVTR